MHINRVLPTGEKPDHYPNIFLILQYYLQHQSWLRSYPAPRSPGAAITSTKTDIESVTDLRNRKEDSFQS